MEPEKKSGRGCPFSEVELIQNLPVPCLAFSRTGDEVWTNRTAGTLLEENSKLLPFLRSAGEKGWSVGAEPQSMDLVQCGESLHYSFQMAMEFPEWRVWLGCSHRTIEFQHGMETAELLSRKLAHEIKNPLQPIQLIVDQWREQQPEFAADAEIVDQQIGRIRSVLGQFRHFYDASPLVLESFDVRTLVGEVAASRRLKFGEKINWVVREVKELPEVGVDKVRLREVLEHLLDNACEAMPDGGLVQIGFGLLSGGNRMYIEISDSGNGMSRETMKNLFMPFFTTKPNHTGLGLIISRKHLTLHGGELQFASQEEIGTTATIRLPVRQSQKHRLESGRDTQ